MNILPESIQSQREQAFGESGSDLAGGSCIRFAKRFDRNFRQGWQGVIAFEIAKPIVASDIGRADAIDQVNKQNYKPLQRVGTFRCYALQRLMREKKLSILKP